MAPENNWLSFSLSSMEMLSSSSSQTEMLQSTMKLAPHFEAASATDDSHPYFYPDNFYGWQNMMRGQELATQSNMNGQDPHSIFTTFMDQNHPEPKLEDFLGGDSTETQDDSSLTHLYDHGGGGGGSASATTYFNDVHQQDFKNLTGFPAFSTNSGSDVDDSVSVARTQVMCVNGGEFTGQSYESAGNELVYAHRSNGGLSLGVSPTLTTTTTTTTNTNALNSDQKAIVAVDSENCKKLAETFGQRTSIYRGVTRHRWTGRYEAHLWDNSCRREGQARKGRQVYLGGYDKEDKAARAYDLAALKYWGASATTNFPVSSYAKEVEVMQDMTKQEFIASLRRKSSGFSRGASIYRGVTRHHQQGRWQARIGRVAGNKDLYLGTFATEEEAAEAYDIAAIKFRGINAVTNFEMNRYDVEAIMQSSLPIGGAAKRMKANLDKDQKPCLTNDAYNGGNSNSNGTSTISFAAIQPVSSIPCGIPFEAAPPYYHHNLFNHHLNSSHGHGGGYAPDTGGPVTVMSTTPVPYMQQQQQQQQQPPAEFFIWPHQSY